MAKIRKAEIKDLGELLGLLNNSINYQINPESENYDEEWVKRFIEDPSYHTLIAESGGNIAGFLIAEVCEKNSSYIESIFVRPEHRKTLGKVTVPAQLYKSYIDYCRNHNIFHITAGVPEENTEVNGLLKNLGFKPGTKLILYDLILDSQVK